MRSRYPGRDTFAPIAVVMLLIGCQPQADESTVELPITAPTEPQVITSVVSEGVTIDLAQGPDQGGYPHHIEISPDGRQVAIFGDEPDTVQVFDLTTGEQLRSLDNQDLHWSLGEALSADWRVLATVDNQSGGLVRDFASLEAVSSPLPSCTYPKALSPDGHMLVLGGNDRCADFRSRVIDWDSGTELIDLGARYVQDAAFDPGTAGNAGDYLALIFDEGLEVYDIARQTMVTAGSFDNALRLAIDPTGTFLAIGNDDGSAVVLNLDDLVAGTSADEAVVQRVAAHDALVIDVAIEGGMLATSSPGSVRLWDIETGNMVGGTEVAADFWTFIAFANQGNYLLYSADHDTLRSLVPNAT